MRIKQKPEKTNPWLDKHDWEITVKIRVNRKNGKKWAKIGGFMLLNVSIHEVRRITAKINELEHYVALTNRIDAPYEQDLGTW